MESRSRFRHIPWFMIFGACALAACTTTQTPSNAPPVVPKPPLLVEGDCPIMLPGVHTAYGETPDGIAFDFIGPAEEVGAVRAKARKLVQEHELGMSQACPCSSVETAQAGTETNMPPAANAWELDTPEGARVIFQAKDKDDIVLLRAHLRRYVQMIEERRCGKENPEALPAK